MATEHASHHPFWFSRALEVPSENASVDVDGTRIVYETWGEVGQPGIVLIHGSNAHLEWWRFTAPFLADKFRIAALDLSGNGDSDWRGRYSGQTFADEVWHVCQAAELGDQPYVVGHSFGGFVALETMHHYGQHMGGVVFMDYTIASADETIEWGMRAEREGVDPGRKLRVYEDKETALGRFRFIPEQPGVDPGVLRHLAEYGLKEVEGGWTWKFDPALFDYLQMGSEQYSKFVDITQRTALLLGENSEDEGALYADNMADMTNQLMPALTFPGTFHHMMFDDPMSVVASLKILLLEWHRQDNAEALQSRLDQLRG